MSDNSERESQSPPSPHAFSGEEFESGSHNEDLGLDGESTGSEGVGEVGRRVGPSGFGTVVVAPVDVGVPVGVPLPKKNMMSLYELESLKIDYAIPECVGLRLPILAEAARYPPEGCVMMMLSRLGYAPGQYNPNFWSILHEVYIAWWLAKRGEPSFEQFMHLYSVSRQQGNVGWVQVNCQKVKEMGYFIGQPPSSQKTVQEGRRRDRAGEETGAPGSAGAEEHCDTSTTLTVVVDPEERQRKLRERREKDRDNGAKKQAKGAPSTAEGSAARAAKKWPRHEGDELLAELEKKRRGLESSIHDVMGGTVLPPFDLDLPPRLPLEMEELFPAVPLVNAFLTGVKIDAGELARTKATDFSDRV
ncbi:unnamed protein product [Prunus brigantina]